MSTVIQDCRTALAGAVTDAGLTCYAYEDWDIPTQLPAATLSLDSADLMDTPDQKFGIRKVTFLLRIYQLVGANAQTALTYQDANIHTVIAALGTDRTLGDAVTNMEITSMDASFERRNQQTIAVCELRVELSPFPNVA